MFRRLILNRSYFQVPKLAIFFRNKRESHIIQPFKSSRCIKASFYIPENRLNFPITNDFRMKISIKLVYQNMTVFFNF